MEKGRFGRRDRLMQEERHDTYKDWGKLPEPTICGTCGSLFQNGRWSWDKATVKANVAVCPACQRIADGYPAGQVEISGEFLRDHRDDILNLIKNREGMEKEERPLERIMAINDTGDRISITTTGVHVARRIGEALSRAYQGDFSYQYGEADKSIRVSWCR